MNRYLVSPHRLASLINLLIPVCYVLQRYYDGTSSIMMIIVHVSMGLSVGSPYILLVKMVYDWDVFVSYYKVLFIVILERLMSLYRPSSFPTQNRSTAIFLFLLSS